MNNAKEIAENIVQSYYKHGPNFTLELEDAEKLARAYLELKKRIVLLLRENTLLILDSIEPRTDKDVTIVGLKKEITKLKAENERLNKYVISGYETVHKESLEEITRLIEENEKLKKSREVLRRAVEFYGDINNWKDISSINESSFKYFYSLRQRTKDFEALNEKYNFYAGKKAREAMQADNEIFADDIK